MKNKNLFSQFCDVVDELDTMMKEGDHLLINYSTSSATIRVRVKLQQESETITRRIWAVKTPASLRELRKIESCLVGSCSCN